MGITTTCVGATLGGITSPCMHLEALRAYRSRMRSVSLKPCSMSGSTCLQHVGQELLACQYIPKAGFTDCSLQEATGRSATARTHSCGDSITACAEASP